jgi:dipeptidyl aminopeptidase/acylaminoacyl peptidase
MRARFAGDSHLKAIQFLATALAAGAFAASAQDAPAPAPAAAKVLATPAAMFGVRESVQAIDISPSGKRIAFVAPGPGRGSIAYVVDLPGGAPRRILERAGNPEYLSWCRFVTEARLVCQSDGVTPVGTYLVPFSRLVAVNDDGTHLVSLGQSASEYDTRLRQFDGEIIDWLPDETGAVLMSREYVPEGGKIGTRQVRSSDGLGVDRIDVVTMKSTKVEGANKLADFYLTDGRGNVRMKGYHVERGGIGEQLSNRTQYQYRLPGSKEWLLFSDWENGQGMQPIAVDADGSSAYVIKRLDGRDALYRVRLDGSLASELVFKHDAVDVDGVVRVGRSGRVIGATYAEEKRHVVYFDPEFDKLSRALGKALPALPQVDFAGASRDGNVLLVRAGSDADPGRYFVFDKAAKNLNEIMLARPQLENVVLARVKPVTYASGDGTSIPGYLTLPPGKEDMRGLPAIVLPHGGPSARDEWGFDWLAQYLAHQGYAVLQPNFRGSTGFGDAWLMENGFRNWKTSIGDITAAGKWLVAQGADPARLAIVGWSYGGYAALQSGVVEPGLFTRIVAVAPVTDLEQFKKDNRDYTSFRNVEDMIGSGPHVAEGSPATNAARIQAPVLMFHGTIDVNVAVDQSRRMDAALKAAGKRSELVTFEGLEHSLVDSNVRAHMLERIDAFLKAAPAN